MVLHRPFETASIKGKVKKKHFSRSWNFSTFAARVIERDVLAFRAMCSVAELRGPAVWGFSTSGFHRLFATKPVSSETSKAERG